jgi:hypothetical protein
MQLRMPPRDVKVALQQTLNMRWSDDAVRSDPRTAPSVGIEMCTHAAWVLGTGDGGGRQRSSKHFKLCVSLVVMQCLARLRLELHGFEIRLGRMKRDKVPRPGSLDLPR